jgi:UDP-N-acetylmuramoylalanine-D-glutamate ligase
MGGDCAPKPFDPPHIAVITTVEAVHLENFANIEGIAAAKAEIFAGLQPGGTAVLNRDNRFTIFCWRKLSRRGRPQSLALVRMPPPRYGFGRRAGK